VTGAPLRGFGGRAWAFAALALLATALGGCGFGEGETSTGEATLTVTRDYGEDVLAEGSVENPPKSDTVLGFLDREAEVETRYGGGFVQSIDGLEGGVVDGRRVDWFFYVNGTESPIGAAEVELRAGDRIWWDHHDWEGVMRVPAVVGSWPAPFTTSDTTELHCLDADEAVCDEVRDRIEDAGGEIVAEDEGEENAPAVLVGPWGSVRRSERAPSLDRDPGSSGVFARFEDRSEASELVLFDETLAEQERLAEGGGLVAAGYPDGESPTWVVTGTDEEGVASAAGALRADALENRFAIAVGAEGEPAALPVP
jgi:hypothetical protein